MNRLATPDRADRKADDRLRRRLHSLQPTGTEVEALSARVLEQWNERHGRLSTAPTGLGNSGLAATLGGRASRHRRWAGLTAGLAVCGAIAVVVWMQRPDPALEELMQADVLSQMAIGEM